MLRVSNFAVAVMRMLSAMFFISSRRRHTRYIGDWSSDVCSSDLLGVKLPHLAAWSVARRTAADFYREEFSRQELAKHIEIGRASCRERVLISDVVSFLMKTVTTILMHRTNATSNLLRLNPT